MAVFTDVGFVFGLYGELFSTKPEYQKQGSGLKTDVLVLTSIIMAHRTFPAG
jgi:hypothetical protein